MREKSLGQAAIHRVHLPGILFVVEATFHSVLRHWGGSGVKDRGVEDVWVSVSADLVIVVKSLCTTVACHNIVKINSIHLHARSTHTQEDGVGCWQCPGLNIFVTCKLIGTKHIPGAHYAICPCCCCWCFATSAATSATTDTTTTQASSQHLSPTMRSQKHTKQKRKTKIQEL